MSIDDRRTTALAGSVLASFTGWALTSVTLGWLAVHGSQSAMLVGATLSARLLAFAVTGLPAGALTDRLGNRRMLILSNLASASIGLAFLLTSIQGGGSLPGALILFSSLFGAAEAARTVATSNAAYELGLRRSAIRTIAAISLVAAVGQVIGSAAGGLVLDRGGSAASCALVAACYLTGAVLMVPGVPEQSPTHAVVRNAANIRARLDLVGANNGIRILVAVAIATEVLAFSSIAIEPVYAARVFVVGASGLGALAAARAIGRLTGSLALIVVDTRRRAGQALVAGVAGYGLALGILAAAPSFTVTIVAIMATGLFGCIIDALEQYLLQTAAGPNGRGRAAGLWVFALGWGPIGYLEVSFLSDAAGPRAGPGLNAGIVLLIALGLAVASVGRRLTAVVRDPNGN